MGLYDREYYRTAPRPEGGFGPSTGRGAPIGMRGLGALSVNTWLIVLCVLVFIIDGFTPIVSVRTGRVQAASEQVLNLDLRLGDGFLAHPEPGKLWQSLHVRSTNELAGWAEVMRMHTLTAWLHFSTRLAGVEFWRFIGFQFLHGNLTHLVFNMIGLFFFGPIVEEYLGRKRYLAYYLLCGCCGALLYLLLNGIGYAVQLRYGPVAIPGLLFSDPSTPLVGASAGIFGVLMAGAYLAPNIVVLLFFFLPMRLRTLAYALVAIALFTLITGGRNAGGEAGHLGGAIAGYYFIRHPHHLHNFFDILGRADPTSHHYRKGAKPSPSRIRGAGGGAASGATGRSRAADPREVDRILDKINREGLHSLSDAEKRTLAEASKR